MPYDYSVTVPGASAPTEVTSGQVFRITAADLSGSTLTDSVGALALTAAGTPNTETSPEGVNLWLNFDGGTEGFAKTDGVGTLPVGNASRTLIFCGRFDTVGTGTTAAWGGFVYGDRTTGESFGLLADGINHTLDIDLFGIDYPGTSIDDGEPVIVTITFDSATGTLKRFEAKSEILVDENLTLATGTESIRIMRNANGTQFRNGNIAYAAVYDRALNTAEVGQMVDWLLDQYLDATSVPVVSSVAFTATGATTGTVGFTVSKGGVQSIILSPVNSAPSVAQITAGKLASGADAPFFDVENLGAAGSASVVATGLDASTLYYPFVYAADAVGTGSTVTGGTSDTTDASDPAPTTISPDRIDLLTTATVGSTLATFTTDVFGSTFAFSPDPGDYDVTSGGVVTLQATPDAGTQNVTVRATAPGGAFDDFVVPFVAAAPGSPLVGPYSYAADVQVAPDNLRTYLLGLSGTIPASGSVWLIEQIGGGR